MPQEEMVEGIQNEQNPEEVEAVTTDQQTESAEKSEEEDPRKVKKYSIEEVDRIVKRRLAQQHKKFEKILNPVETELDRREREVTIRECRAEGKERLVNGGLPVELLDLMDLSNKDGFEESCSKVIEIFQKFKEDQKIAFAKQYFKGQTPKYMGKTYNPGKDLKSAFAPKE